jgi:hypothetical protein
MGAARTRVACGEHYVSRELVLNVEVELLDHPLFEIQVLGLNGSKVAARRYRSRREWNETVSTEADGQTAGDAESCARVESREPAVF